MNVHDLIKLVQEKYSQCRSYKDVTDCKLSVALPAIKSLDELIIKEGTLKHEYRRDKMFDMRWEWLPGQGAASAELDYKPNTFSVSLDERDQNHDITQTETLKANLLHGILSMETEEDIFLIKRLIFFGEAKFWLEDFIFEWTLNELEKEGRKVWQLKRVDKGHDDPHVEMLIDQRNYTLLTYSSDASVAYGKYAAASETERAELLDTLFGDEIRPAAVVQKYRFREVQID